jgi:hypothetical protein
VALVRDKRNAYRFLMEKSEVKIPFGRARRRWENNSTYVYLLMKYDGKLWTRSIWFKWQDLVKRVMYAPSGSVECG